MRRKWPVWLGLLAALAVGLYLGRTVWLEAIGRFLVRAEPPQQADLAVVLAGDGYGHRIMRAVELARQGFVKQVLVDGPFGHYDANEADLAIAFAVKRGAPREILIAFPIRARSTMAEAQLVDKELRRRNARKALIVTSNYHTRRARCVFRRYGSPEVQYVVVASRDEDFAPESWWRTRDGRKITLIEYIKLVNSWLLD